MSITYGEMHDYAISSYFVDFENAKITLKLFWPYKEKAFWMKEDEPNIDSIIFFNVMGYGIESGVHNNLMKKENYYGMHSNDLFDIFEYTLSEYLKEYGDSILVDIGNRVPFRFKDRNEFMKKLNEYNLNIYVVNTSTGDLGLCGWILSEKMEIVFKSEWDIIE